MDAVGEGEDADLLPRQELFDQDLPARVPEDTIHHHLVKGTLRLIAVCAHQHTLASGQPVRLDHHRSRARSDVLVSLTVGGEHLSSARGDGVLEHQRLGEGLGGLDAGGGLRRADDTQALGLESVDDAGLQ